MQKSSKQQAQQAQQAAARRMPGMHEWNARRIVQSSEVRKTNNINKKIQTLPVIDNRHHSNFLF